MTFFKLHGLHATERNQAAVTRMKGSWAARHHIGCRDLTAPALAPPVGTVSHGLVPITLPAPPLSSVHESLPSASGLQGSVSSVLASQAPPRTHTPRCSQNCPFSWASFPRGSSSGHWFLHRCPSWLLAPGIKGHTNITLLFPGSRGHPSHSHPGQRLQQPARPHTGHPDSQVARPDGSHAAALGPLSGLFYRREIYFPEVLGQEKTRFLEVCQEGGNPPRKQTRPFSL